MRTLLREFEQDYLRMCAHPHGRAPGPSPARCVYVQGAKTLQSIGKLSEDSARGQREWKDLSAVGVPGDLQAHARSLDDGQPAGHMAQQNAGFVGAEPHSIQSCVQADWAGGVAKGHSSNVEAIYRHFLIVQNSHAGTSDRLKIDRKST